MTVFKWGLEQLVNTNTNGLQFAPEIATIGGGGFVVVWTDGDAAGGDGSDTSIKMQRYDAAGEKAGAETVVNTTTAFGQSAPTVAMLADGSFEVAWRDESVAPFQIHYRHFAADGTALDASDRVLASADSADRPHIEALAGGGFVIAYEDVLSGQRNILAQRFDDTGSTVGTPINVAITGDNENHPKIAELSDGTLVAVWEDTTSHQVLFQHVSAAGGLIGSATPLADSPSSPHAPDIAALTNGGFVVAWSDQNQPYPSSSAVRAKIFDALASPVGEEFAVNTASVSANLAAARLVALDNGGFVAVYTSFVNGFDARGQMFDEFGSRIGAEFLVNNTDTGNQQFPTIAALGDGRLVITWADDGQTGGDTSDEAIRMQILDPRDGLVDGTPGNDTLFGNDLFNDQISGLSGNDKLIGMAGTDWMYGGQDNDTYVVDNPGDRVIELLGEGTDTVFSSVSFTLPGNVERLTLTGAAGLSGIGNGIANSITGNAGANLLNGNVGNDTLAGGAGRDKFAFSTALSASTNVDHITDFSVPADTIVLENAIFHALTQTGVLAAAAFFKGAAAHDANDHIVYNPANGFLIYDVNGNHAGGAVHFATLAAHLAVTNADFLVV